MTRSRTDRGSALVELSWLGILLVVAGAALVPGPQRAAEAGAREERKPPSRPAARGQARAAGTVQRVG